MVCTFTINKGPELHKDLKERDVKQRLKLEKKKLREEKKKLKEQKKKEKEAVHNDGL